jgi:hypothetical protein
MRMENNKRSSSDGRNNQVGQTMKKTNSTTKARVSRRVASPRSPLRPYETKRGARGHVWKRHEDGTLDILAYNLGGYHNGPMCVRCGYGFCLNCFAGPQKECTANSEICLNDGQ